MDGTAMASAGEGNVFIGVFGHAEEGCRLGKGLSFVELIEENGQSNYEAESTPALAIVDLGIRHVERYR